MVKILVYLWSLVIIRIMILPPVFQISQGWRALALLSLHHDSIIENACAIVHFSLITLWVFSDESFNLNVLVSFILTNS